MGSIEIQTPRDRNGTFEPELLPKRQKTLGVDLDRQIIALYARGASYADIRDHLMDMYGLEASPATILRDRLVSYGPGHPTSPPFPTENHVSGCQGSAGYMGAPDSKRCPRMLRMGPKAPSLGD